MGADAWDRIKSSLAAKLSEGAYQNWISRTAFSSLRDGELTVRVPNETTEAWIRQEYGSEVQAAIEELQLPIRKIHFTSEAVAAAAAGASSYCCWHAQELQRRSLRHRRARCSPCC